MLARSLACSLRACAPPHPSTERTAPTPLIVNAGAVANCKAQALGAGAVSRCGWHHTLTLTSSNCKHTSNVDSSTQAQRAGAARSAQAQAQAQVSSVTATCTHTNRALPLRAHRHGIYTVIVAWGICCWTRSKQVSTNERLPFRNKLILWVGGNTPSATVQKSYCKSAVCAVIFYQVIMKKMKLKTTVPVV